MPDLRDAWRALRAAPLVSAVAVLSLALGIGATTAVITAGKAWLISPYPFPEPDRLVRLEARHVSGSVGAHYRDFLDWRERNAVFEEVAILETTSRVVTDRDETRRVRSYVATAGAFRVLGVTPILGRFFSEQEDAPGKPYVVLVSVSLGDGGNPSPCRRSTGPRNVGADYRRTRGTDRRRRPHERRTA